MSRIPGRGALAPVLVLIAALWPTPAAQACGVPPDPLLAECRILVPGQVAIGVPFEVIYSVTNLGMGEPGPPYADDLSVILSVDVISNCDGESVEALIDPEEHWVWLDDATSPHADFDTSATRSFMVRIDGPPGSYQVDVNARANSGSRPLDCTASACLVAALPDAVPDKPSVEFLEPSLTASGGATVPFRLRVLRNGYETSNPLVLRVIPDNAADPLDLFPIDPPGLTTTGVEIFADPTADEQLIPFDCSVHGPCYVGVANEYHVTIHDGPTLLCDSRWERPDGLARVVVDDAPELRWDLLDVDDASGDGLLLPCEEGQVLARLAVRNPFSGQPLTDGIVDIPLPDNLVLLSSTMHYHDHPMDGIDPDPAELEPDATLSVVPGGLRLSFPQLEVREVVAPVGPSVFRDLIDVDLQFAVPPGGVGDALVFEAAHLEAMVIDGPFVADGAALEIPIQALEPPRVSEGPGAEPLRVTAGPQLSWEDAGSADNYALQRGDLADLHAGDYGSCLESELAATEYADLSSGEGDRFYLVTGRNCAGRGPLGFDSFATERASAEPCP